MAKAKGLLYVIIFSATWAISTIVAKAAAIENISPLNYGYQTALIAALVALIYILIKNPKQLKQIKEPKLLGKLALLGFLGTGIGSVVTVYALKYSQAISYGFLIKTTAVFSILLAYFTYKEPLTKRKWALLGVLLAGVYLVSTKGQQLIPQWSDLIIIGIAVALSIANILTKAVAKNHAAELIAFTRMLIGGLLVLVFTALINQDVLHVENWFYVLLGGVTKAITIYFVTKALEVISVSYSTMMSSLYSVFVVILGFVVFGEVITLVQAIGGALILISAILIQKKTDIHAH